MSIAASTQTNELTSLSNDTYTLQFLQFGGLPSPGNLGDAIRLEEGGAVGNFYGKRFAGFTEDGGWLYYKSDGSAVQIEYIIDQYISIVCNSDRISELYSNR